MRNARLVRFPASAAVCAFVCAATVSVGNAGSVVAPQGRKPGSEAPLVPARSDTGPATAVRTETIGEGAPRAGGPSDGRPIPPAARGSRECSASVEAFDPGLVRTIVAPASGAAGAEAGPWTLESLFADPAAPLRVVRSADGTMSVDIRGRFLNVYIARLGADGTVSGACVTSIDAARLAMQPPAPAPAAALEEE